MAGYRKDRVAEDIKREIVALIRELKDPRVKDKRGLYGTRSENDFV